jgi:hypothetical protein|tara:strand:- start:925 stop:1101 length:177 start_codon:yes stop_codon:yes gene_type:complete
MMSKYADNLYYCEWCDIVTNIVADKKIEFNGFDYNACSICNEIHGFDTLEYLEEVGRK